MMQRREVEGMMREKKYRVMTRGRERMMKEGNEGGAMIAGSHA